VLTSTESSISPGSALHCVHKGMFLKGESFMFLVEWLAAVSERSEEGDPGISRGSSCCAGSNARGRFSICRKDSSDAALQF
jgi:hypothetical protein